MSKAEEFTSRLEKCLQTGNGRWQAICPAHPDKSPSLSIKEAEDGRVLIHCFAGCDALSVVNAIGLDLTDLFPPDGNYANNYKPLFRTKEQEKTVDEWFVEIIENHIMSGKKISEADKAKYVRLKSQLR